MKILVQFLPLENGKISRNVSIYFDSDSNRGGGSTLTVSLTIKMLCFFDDSSYLFAKSVLKVGCSCERVFSEVSTCQKYLCDNFSTILNKLDA